MIKTVLKIMVKFIFGIYCYDKIFVEDLEEYERKSDGRNIF